MDPVYREVTGGAATRLYTSSGTGAVKTFITSHLAAGHALSAGTWSNPSGPVVGLHAYMVKGIGTSGGTTLVTVYNPWGYDGRLADSNSSDRLITMTLAQFQRDFSTVITALV